MEQGLAWPFVKRRVGTVRVFLRSFWYKIFGSETLCFSRKIKKPAIFQQKPVFHRAAGGHRANCTTSVTVTDFYTRKKQRKPVAMCGFNRNTEIYTSNLKWSIDRF